MDRIIHNVIPVAVIPVIVIPVVVTPVAVIPVAASIMLFYGEIDPYT
jgi:hypothetical protein